MKTGKPLLGGTLTAMSAVSLLIAGQAQAQVVTQRTEIHMVAAPSDVPLDEDRTITQDEPVLVSFAQSPRSVRIEDATTVGAMKNQTIDAGSILFGRYDDASWTYCTIDRANAANEAVNELIVGVFSAGLSLLDGPAKYIQCLHDADNDGTFDTAWSGGETQTENAFLAYSLFKQPMETSPRYTRVPFTDGPAMPVEIEWSKSRRAGTITLSTVIGDLSVNKKQVPVPTPGGEPETVSLLGAEIEIVSYDAEADTMTYRVKSNTSRQYLRLPATLTVTTSYY